MGKLKKGNYMFQTEIQENYSGRTTKVTEQAGSKNNHWEVPSTSEPKVIDAKFQLERDHR